MEPEKISEKYHFQGDSQRDIPPILRLKGRERLEVRNELFIKITFDEYHTNICGSLEPIAAKDYVAGVYAILSEPLLDFADLHQWARDPPTKEPWAEALFVHQVKQYLCDLSVSDWKPATLNDLDVTDEERRNSRVVDLMWCEFVLEILERMQRDRYIDMLAEVALDIRCA
ncbi:hypothetical protein GGS23DRAFT_620842 [Durotheca rogersii]|uniref:uncharacterized protein n=1 Tax=Durotheca rogersii TaxID=419775 RepID=UPI00221FD388|nr:uncharacterized protein GGS23DRAFT_620842 [Durotheca rogersii]KAI5863950.1 hypothetical protein GGS23DRAFT_620842 [Durotheca rogersii]